MKKALLAILVCAAVAGVVIYLNDPESFEETYDDLKDEASDKYNKIKKGLSKSKDDLEKAV